MTHVNATTEPVPDQDFLNATGHVPEEIAENRGAQFEEVNAEVERVEQPGSGWTVGEIASLFNGVFTTLVCARIVLPFGGEHWSIPPEGCEKLGIAWLPFFREHVPYESKPTWLPNFLLYITIMTVTREVVGPAIVKEIEQFRENQKKGQIRSSWMRQNPGKPFPGFSTGSTQTGSTATETRQEFPATSANENPERPSGNGFQSNFRSID